MHPLTLAVDMQGDAPNWGKLDHRQGSRKPLGSLTEGRPIQSDLVIVAHGAFAVLACPRGAPP